MTSTLFLHVNFYQPACYTQTLRRRLALSERHLIKSSWFESIVLGLGHPRAHMPSFKPIQS